MSVNHLYLDTTPETLASAVTTLAFPPVEVYDSSQWNREGGVLPKFDLEMWAAGATDLTLATLYGCVQIPKTIASTAATGLTNANDEIDLVSHGLVTGDGPIRLSQATLPAELDASTDYYAIRVDDDNFQVATSPHNAVEGTQVAFTDDGTGTLTFVGAGSGGLSNALRWLSYGLLGQAADGAISLTATLGYSIRVEHRPRTILYGISATLSAAVATTISVLPVRQH